MNKVHRSVALQTAHKLRSAAEALWADASNQCGPLRDALQVEADAIQKRADSIEEQVKPTIDEPTEWGSLIRARVSPDLPWMLVTFVPAPAEVADVGERKYSWYSDQDSWWTWLDFCDVEVLRIGVGEAPADADEFMTAAGFDARMEAATPVDVTVNLGRTYTKTYGQPLAAWESELLNQQYRRDVAAAVLAAMDVDQYLIDAVANARPL